MQIIDVKFKDGVFIPAEPISMGEDQEAVVIIENKGAGADEQASFYQKQASQYFKQNFPALEISKDILELVGILKQCNGKYDKAEYHEHVGRKYK